MKKYDLFQFNLLAVVLVAPPHAKLAASEPPSLFERKNIIAWCIEPVDSVIQFLTLADTASFN